MSAAPYQSGLRGFAARNYADPERWKLKLNQHEFHPVQYRLRTDPERFKVAAAGRRSGKTEEALRKILSAALRPIPGVEDPRFLFGGPTYQQSKDIAWRWLKRHIPANFIEYTSATELCIRLINGSEIWVKGMDKPERAEGVPWDGVVLDEYANMKEETWGEHLRPSLSTRGRVPGWCWFIGTPDGRNHFYDLWIQAHDREDWAAYRWQSADILDPVEIEQARRDLDELSFTQEYGAEFLAAEGRIYYGFDPRPFPRGNVNEFEIPWLATGEMMFQWRAGIDFNVHPLCACLGWQDSETMYIYDEFHLNSADTQYLGEQLYSRCVELDRSFQPAKLTCYPDPSGRSRHTSQQGGKTDWHLLRQAGFEVRGRARTPSRRDRYNATNTRLHTGDGRRRMIIHPRCKNVIRSLEGCTYEDEKGDLSHQADGLGYWVEMEFPITPLHRQIQGIRF